MKRQLEMAIVVIAILILSLNPTGKTNDLLSGKMKLRRKITIPVWISKFNIYRADYQI